VKAAGGGPSAEALMREAVKAREASYSPYSRFAVGAALLGASGRIYHGCNVENASFGLTCCAERTAAFKAVSEGEQEFLAVAVTARTGHGAPPCGACRQVLAEFGGDDLPLLLAGPTGAAQEQRLGALLPQAFRLR